MARKTLKLAWIENDNSRTICLRKRRAGLMKKVKEISTLCDVKACVIIFSPNEAKPVIWQSSEAARDLLDNFFALPEVEQKKKETSLESYLKEKTKKVHEQLMKSDEKNMEYTIDQLMVQLHCSRRIVDLKLSEIYSLQFFSRDMLIHYKKKLEFMTYPPLCDPPMPPTDVQFHNFATTAHEDFVESDQGDERAGKTDEIARRISIDSLRSTKSIYLIDKWYFTPEEPNSSMYQQVGMKMVSSYNKDQDPGSYRPFQGSRSNGNSNLEMKPIGPQSLTFPGSYRPFQGSSSNGNPNTEMKPIGPQLMTFPGFVEPVYQPFQDYYNPIMAMSQPREYPFDFMGHELGVKEEGSNIYNGQFPSSNTIPTNDSVRHEPPPNGTTASQDQIEPTEISSLHPTKRFY